MNVSDNIRLLEGGKTPNVAADALREIRANLPALLEYMDLTAELEKAKFDALKRNGFSDAQALELCRIFFGA